jgi:hypothetical protein
MTSKRRGAVAVVPNGLGGKKKEQETCIELIFHSPPPTPLLPALTLSVGGKAKVSRRVGMRGS